MPRQLIPSVMDTTTAPTTRITRLQHNNTLLRQLQRPRRLPHRRQPSPLTSKLRLQIHLIDEEDELRMVDSVVALLGEGFVGEEVFDFVEFGAVVEVVEGLAFFPHSVGANGAHGGLVEEVESYVADGLGFALRHGG